MKNLFSAHINNLFQQFIGLSAIFYVFKQIINVSELVPVVNRLVFRPLGVLIRSLIANMMSPPHLHSEQKRVGALGLREQLHGLGLLILCVTRLVNFCSTRDGIRSEKVRGHNLPLAVSARQAQPACQAYGYL